MLRLVITRKIISIVTKDTVKSLIIVFFMRFYKIPIDFQNGMEAYIAAILKNIEIRLNSNIIALLKIFLDDVSSSKRR